MSLFNTRWWLARRIPLAFKPTIIKALGVPEPVTLAPLGTGVAALCTKRRSRKRASTVLTIAIGLATLGPARADAQTFAPGPYYATPSWDMTLPVNVRFVVLSNFNNEAVLDRETGLVWTRSLTQVGDWFRANATCLQTTTGNRAGWRLPAVNELATLFDPALTGFDVHSPPFPVGHPFAVPQANEIVSIWTATTSAAKPGDHRTIDYVRIFEPPKPPLSLVYWDRTANDGYLFGWAFCVRGGSFGQWESTARRHSPRRFVTQTNAWTGLAGVIAIDPRRTGIRGSLRSSPPPLPAFPSCPACCRRRR